MTMILKTEYLGLELPHPFIVGAGPFADSLDSARRVEDAGAAALTMRSLFEEQLSEEAIATHMATESHADSSGEAQSYFANPDDFVIGPDEYLDRLSRIKEAIDIPVISSLNGYSLGGWLDYANRLEAAGADALELNLYYIATNASESAQDIEDRSIAMVREVKNAVSIPLTIKLSPFYTSPCHFASRLQEVGADGITLFNRFFEPDIDIEELEITSKLQLSDSRELLLRLRWLGLLSAQLETTQLGVTGGIHSAVDAAKAIMAGATAVQMVSSLLRGGLGQLARVRKELEEWMDEKSYESISEMRGSMNQNHCPDPRALARSNYMHILQTWKPE